MTTIRKSLALAAILAAAPALADTGQIASPADVARCKAIGLSGCPEPFDAVLPSASALLTWDQHTRLIGFRNTYRLYQGDVFHTLGTRPYPLPPAPIKLPRLSYEMDGHG